MSEPEITPHKITKPIQLLAAWLGGLAVVDGSFLTAAATIETPTWVPGALVVASIVNVPLFIFSVFLLQTKFRPEMQEDSYYSEYLQKKYSDKPESVTALTVERPLGELAEKIVAQVSAELDDQPQQQKKVVELLKDSEVEYLAKRFSSNRTLSELYMFPNLWDELVKSWGDNGSFLRDISLMTDSGLIELPSENPKDAKLTNIGEAVAKKLEGEKKLWNQNKDRSMIDDP